MGRTYATSHPSMETHMSEPISGTAAGAAGWHLLGGAAGAAGLAAIVVMCMTRPKSNREWVVALISTVMSSIGGGAAVIMQFNLLHWAQSYIGLVAMLGVVFACGLPGWAIVRWLFNYIQKKQGADLGEIYRDVKEVL